MTLSVLWRILFCQFAAEVFFHFYFDFLLGKIQAEQIVKLGNSSFCRHIVSADRTGFCESGAGFISTQSDSALLTLGADSDDGAMIEGLTDNRQQSVAVAWNIAGAEGFQNNAFQAFCHNRFKEAELDARKNL